MADEKTNIEMFDIFSGYIFEKTYKEFPKCVELNTQKEVQSILNELSGSMSFDEKMLIFTETVLWLTNNGFIRYTHPNVSRPALPRVIDSFLCVELTLNGLSILKSPIPQTLSKKTVGTEIVEKFKEGSISEAGKLTMNAILNHSANRFLGE